MHAAPETIGLVYRQVGDTHVFTAKNLKGLVHIGSHDRKKAFQDVLLALGEHVKLAYSVDASYVPNLNYEQFSKHVETENDLEGNYFSATLARACAA